VAKKLTDVHIDEVLRHRALGLHCTEIAKLLEHGIKTGDGLTLAPVVIDVSTLRFHCRHKAGRIHEHRREAFGNLEAEAMAWPGWRLREFRRLYDQSVEAAETSEKDSERRQCLALASRILEQAGTEISRLVPKEGPRHLHVHGNGDGAPALTEALASKLTELARAGMLEEAAGLLGSGDDLSTPAASRTE